MIFEIPYWKDRLESAKTQEDFAQLLQDLPDNLADITGQDTQQSGSAVQYSVPAPLFLNTRKGKIVVG
jgi:hypothetical protein